MTSVLIVEDQQNAGEALEHLVEDAAATAGWPP